MTPSSRTGGHGADQMSCRRGADHMSCRRGGDQTSFRGVADLATDLAADSAASSSTAISIQGRKQSASTSPRCTACPAMKPAKVNTAAPRKAASELAGIRRRNRYVPVAQITGGSTAFTVQAAAAGTTAKSHVAGYMAPAFQPASSGVPLHVHGSQSGRCRRAARARPRRRAAIVLEEVVAADDRDAPEHEPAGDRRRHVLEERDRHEHGQRQLVAGLPQRVAEPMTADDPPRRVPGSGRGRRSPQPESVRASERSWADDTGPRSVSRTRPWRSTTTRSGKPTRW